MGLGDVRRKFLRGCSCCNAGRDRMSRRGFIAGATAFTAAAVGGARSPARAQAAHRVDVHHHITPPAYLAALKKAGRDTPPVANWTVQKSIEDMDRGGVATAITSPTTPHLGFLPKEEAARVARESNEYAKKLMSDHPGRFGVFAMLPMPHVDASLAEIEHVLDALKVDGIGMMTSYGDKWLGDPAFAPVFDELNRRKATVYTHPTAANCCVDLVPGISDAYIEFGADTARTIASLVFTGAAQRLGDINFIFSHGGGVLTAVAERFQFQILSRPPYQGKFTRASVDAQLQRFYYDTAQVANAVTIGALAKLVPTTQIVFGSDFPYRTSADHVSGLQRAFGADDLKAIDRENALRILPRLKTA